MNNTVGDILKMMETIKLENREMTKVNSIEDLQRITPMLDVAQEVETSFKTGDGHAPIENEVGVYNVSKGTYVKSMSKGYQIIQHRDVFEAVSNVFGSLGLRINGRFDNYGDKVKLDCYFEDDEGTPIKDDANGINLGVRIVNSFNGNCAMRIEMFAIRMVCMNGMTFGNTLNVREVMIHKGQKKTYEMIEESVMTFIKTMTQSYNTLNYYISEMMKDTLEFELCNKIIEGVVRGKKHQKKIKEIIERDYGKKDVYTRWEIYNSITNITVKRMKNLEESQ
jgi:hypothetical protein